MQVKLLKKNKMTIKYPQLFNSFKLGNIILSNRVVMAPMTRSRAINNLPNDLLVEYYSQRANAGLIITEGTSPSLNGLGYARIPGLYNTNQINEWKKVTDAVHEKGGKIFVQLMHTGRITHPLNLPEGGKVLAPSAIAASATQMYTDAEGMKPLPIPGEMTELEIQHAIKEYADSANAAILAGFDGVELHGANGYLIDQFLNFASNTRSDKYGGSLANRNRFAIEVTEAVVDAIGKNRVGIRLSPFGAFNEMASNETTEAQYVELAEALRKIEIVYIHLVDHSSMGAPVVPQTVKDGIRKAFGGNIILSGGYNAERAEADLENGKGELVAFGKPFISNPDLVEKIKNSEELVNLDPDTLYSAGEKGYTDYPLN